MTYIHQRDIRKFRADQLADQIMQLLDSHGLMVTPYMRRDLHALLHCRGAEIITDADRGVAGLPPRDHNGWTVQELQILENARMMALIQPIIATTAMVSEADLAEGISYGVSRMKPDGSLETTRLSAEEVLDRGEFNVVNGRFDKP